MSFPHEVIAALPTAAPADKELLRALLTRRFAYALAASESASDFVAKDPVSSIPPLYLVQNSTLYAYDETDTTTSASAVCLVTNDACRYKSGVVEPPYSVLTYSTTAQPADVDVSDGDTFLLPIGATGADWAGKAGQIAMRVGAKWHFAINPIGRPLYVEDEDTKYYRNASGVWTAGNGANEFAANSIPITAIIGAKASFVVKVEDQTTNAPPASPVAPVAYVIGPSPTGAWAGKAGQLAACLADGSYEYIVPATGDEVFDKALNINVKFNGTAWVSAAGAIVGFKRIFNAASSAGTVIGSVAYGGYAPTTSPTTTSIQRRDDSFLTYTAKKENALLQFRYAAAAQFAIPGSPTEFVGCLYRESETTPLDWRRVGVSSANGVIDLDFYITTSVGVQAEHSYKFTLVGFDGSNGANSFSRRNFTVTEYA